MNAQVLVNRGDPQNDDLIRDAACDPLQFFEKVTVRGGLHVKVLNGPGGQPNKHRQVREGESSPEVLARELAGERPGYFSMGAYRPGSVSEYRGRSHENVTALRAFVFDIEGSPKKYGRPNGPAQGYADGRTAMQAIKTFITSSGLRPSFLVHTGSGGRHLYFVLAHPLERDEWVPRAHALAALAKKHGLLIDEPCTRSTAQIMRAVGSVHQDTGVEVTAERDRFEVYSREEFDALVGYVSAVELPPGPKAKAEAGNDLVGTVERPQFSYTKASEQCGAMRGAAADGGRGTPHPVWILALRSAALSVEGKAFAHQISSGHAGYDQAATDRKLDSLTGGPAGCDAWANAYGAGGPCDQCSHRGKVKSPAIQLGDQGAGGVVGSVGADVAGDTPEPVSMNNPLPAVSAFHALMLPRQLSAYAADIAERMSCPVDFAAVGIMVSLATAIGSRVYCKPYDKGTWLVPSGLWGMVVSPPSAIKTPPLTETLRPLQELDRVAANKFTKDVEQYQIQRQIYENAVKAAIKSGAAPVGLTAPTEPAMTRYVVNDTSYERLIEIAAANPAGVLVWRDELMGWFHSLSKDNQKEARGLYLTGWSGTESYATDRIGRGHVRADRLNISLLGTIQPNVLRQVVYDAVSGGAGDDGLVARFQLSVYPDPVREYVKVDRYPDLAAMQAYEDLIRRLVSLNPAAISASSTPDGKPYLAFDEAAQKLHDAWRQTLETRIRAVDSDEHPAMLAHLGKYRSLFPKLALILHLAAGHIGPIGTNAANRAKLWTLYLEAHARRVYHTATNRTAQCAVALANKITAGKLQDGFTRSDVLLREWAGLRTAEDIGIALTVLRDGYWLTSVEDRSTGGRPAERFRINPRVRRAPS